MALKVKWSKYADHSFDRILNYLEAEWGENITRAFVRRTYEFLDLLAEFPEIGSIENPEKQIRGFCINQTGNRLLHPKKRFNYSA